MNKKEQRREMFGYDSVPLRHTFTYDGCSVVFYQDTERGEKKKTFHSYIGGDLYMSRAFPPTNMKEFYTCDVYGNYIPISMVNEKAKLREEIRELKEKGEFMTELRVFNY